MKNTYETTIHACKTGYIVQAVVNNLAPLLFIELCTEYSLSLSAVTALSTVNFFFQLLTDAFSASLTKCIGVRRTVVLGHISACLGLICLTILPEIFPHPLAGILGSVILYAFGGGVIEVLISPIVEACPTRNKEAVMSSLHSFYCWGSAGVILITSLWFFAFGASSWRILTVIMAVLPAVNAAVFARVPLYPFVAEEEKEMSLKDLLGNKLFYIFLVLMVCAGSTELAVSQWAAALMEKDLGLSNAVGDLCGPLFFALLMGSSRALYAAKGDRIPLLKAMFCGAAGCIFSYILLGWGHGILPILGCGLCGFSVGIAWPGVFSLAAKHLKNGGAVLYGMLALAGDIGCTLGPTLTGLTASGSLQAGLRTAMIMPVIMLVGLTALKHQARA